MSSKTEVIRDYGSFVSHQKLPELTLKDKKLLTVSADDSKYGDSIWKFHTEIPQDNVKVSAMEIRWNFKVGNSKFLDLKYSELLNSSKDFIYSLRQRPSKRGGALKPTTLIRLFRELKALIYWMDSKNIYSFGFLTPGLIESYVAHVKSTQHNGKTISLGTIQQRLELLDKLWKHRNDITQSIDFAPFPNGGSYKASGLTSEYQKNNKFDYIPDEVAIDIADKAINYIQDRSENIILAHQASKQAYESTLENGLSKSVAQRRERKAVQKYGFDKVKTLTKEIGQLRTSCYIVIDFFSGIRDSEMTSLNLNCIESDEEEGYIWIHGKSYKVAHNVIHPRWMAPPIVKEAVNVLTRLSIWIRKALQEQIQTLENSLLVDVVGPQKQKDITKEIARMKKIENRLFLVMSSKKGNSIDVNKTIHAQLKDFMLTQNIVKYCGRTWNLHPHQFRKTFVRFMVKNSVNIRYLQEHFKHISLSMTAWYDIDDVELVNEIAEFHKEFTGQKLNEFFDSQELAGAGGDLIMSNRRDYFAGIIAEDKMQIIESMSETVTLRSTGVSWCLGDVEVGKCSGVHGCMISPANVNHCSQAIVTPEFLPAWENMERNNEELLERDDIGVHQKAAISSFLMQVVKPTIKKLDGIPNA